MRILKKKIKNSQRINTAFIIICVLVIAISGLKLSKALYKNQTKSLVINVKVGELNYQLISDDFIENSSKVAVENGSIKIIEIQIVSKNTIPSKYELMFLEFPIEGLSVEYTHLTQDQIIGEIGETDSKKLVRVAINNTSGKTQTIEFGINAGYIFNELDLIGSINKLYFEPYIYGYNGEVQELIIPENGYYLFELWGAQGFGYTTDNGGKGAYVKGIAYFEKGKKLYVYVGQTSMGTYFDSDIFNGGVGTSSGRGGGGATDIRQTGGTWNSINSLKNRIIVAGGGGSATGGIGGYGGGLVGGNGAGGALGGSQTTGGLGENFSNGSFGIGGNGAGGGGGYYGGGGGLNANGGGGGSSYISGYAGVNSINDSETIIHNNQTIHFTNKYFIKGYMQAGINEGNGKVKVAYLGLDYPEKTNTNLNNIRYIKSCINGNVIDNGNNWNEIQAIVNGVNVAKDKNVVGTAAALATHPYSRFVDGIVSNSVYAHNPNLGLQCLTVDLGTTYNIDELVLWLPRGDFGNIDKYNDNTLSVGDINVTGTNPLSTIIHQFSGTTGYSETHQGRRYTAWD